MLSVGDLKNELQNRWGNHPSAGISIAIIDALARTPKDELRMLTFLSFKNFLSYPEVDEPLIRAVNLLANTSVHALDAKLLFVDEEEEEFELEPEALEEAKREGGLAHPTTGRMVPDYERRLFPFFVASDRFLEAKERA